MAIDLVVPNIEIGIDPVLISLLLWVLFMEPLDLLLESAVVSLDSGQISTHAYENR